MSDGILRKIVVPSQGRSEYPVRSISAMTIDKLIQWILEKRIRQQPRSYVFISFHGDVIYIT